MATAVLYNNQDLNLEPAVDSQIAKMSTFTELKKGAAAAARLTGRQR